MMGVVIVNYECFFVVSLVKVLVEAGADVNVKDEFSSSQRIAAGRKAHHSQGQYHVTSCHVTMFLCHVT